MIPLFIEKSSPIEFIKKVKTPTLVIVGERDAECPAPQSYEFWHALKDARRPDTARHSSRRRPSLPQTREPD